MNAVVLGHMFWRSSISVVCVVSACLFDSGCSIYDHNILENAKRSAQAHSEEAARRAQPAAELSEFLEPTIMRIATAGTGIVAAPNAAHSSAMPAVMKQLDAGAAQGSRRLGQLADDDAGVSIAVPSPPTADAGNDVPPAVAEASPACRGRIGYVAPSGHCYFVFATPLNWHQSRDECQNLGGHLATITVEREHQFVASIPIDVETWIGLSNFGATSFSWTSNEELTFTSWEPGAPRSRQEAAAVILPDTGLWSDRPPPERHPALCELVL
jgi:hypothetical protein